MAWKNSLLLYEQSERALWQIEFLHCDISKTLVGIGIGYW